jgi:hypothetical protein
VIDFIAEVAYRLTYRDQSAKFCEFLLNIIILPLASYWRNFEVQGLMPMARVDRIINV